MHLLSYQRKLNGKILSTSERLRVRHQKRTCRAPPGGSEQNIPAGTPEGSLRQNDNGLRTVGFPALRPTTPKRVIFSSPLHARCMSIDGICSIDCLVLSVWETGAQLQVRRPSELADFYLLFTSSLRPVFRQCRRLSTCSNVIQVAYQRKQPDFLLKAGLDA